MITEGKQLHKNLVTSQDSHQNDELAEYERDKSSNFNSFRWVSDDSWEMWDCYSSSTFRTHLCHVCSSYQRNIKIVPAPFITNINCTWTERNSYYYKFYSWKCIFLGLSCLPITRADQKKCFLFHSCFILRWKVQKDSDVRNTETELKWQDMILSFSIKMKCLDITENKNIHLLT